jgi:hypothetical protein
VTDGFVSRTYSLYDADVDTWKLVLNLANKLEFKEVKELAIRELRMKKEWPLVEDLKMVLHRRPSHHQLVEARQFKLVLALDAMTIFVVFTARTFLLLFAFSWTLLILCMIRDFFPTYEFYEEN